MNLSGLSSLSKLNHSQLFNGNNNGEQPNCKQVACEPKLNDDEKRKRMLIEYCKIISDNRGPIANEFLKSFQQLNEELNTKKFMEMIHEIIFDYLKKAFQDNKFTQTALLIDLKPIITTVLENSIKENSGDLTLEIVYNTFVNKLQHYRSDSSTNNTQSGGGGNENQLLQQILDKLTQLQPQYPIPIAKNVKESDYPEIENGDNKILTDVARILEKNVDGNTVNSGIFEIIKKTITEVLDEKKDIIYGPLINAFKIKIKNLISDIGSTKNDLKVTLLYHMLTNEPFIGISDYSDIKIVIQNIISDILDGLNTDKDGFETLHDIIDNVYDIYVPPMNSNPNTNNFVGGNRKNKKYYKAKKSQKSIRPLRISKRQYVLPYLLKKIPQLGGLHAKRRKTKKMKKMKKSKPSK
jgi:hypothetical protein